MFTLTEDSYSNGVEILDVKIERGRPRKMKTKRASKDKSYFSLAGCKMTVENVMLLQSGNGFRKYFAHLYIRRDKWVIMPLALDIEFIQHEDSSRWLMRAYIADTDRLAIERDNVKRPAYFINHNFIGSY